MPRAAEATLGGVVATNWTGPRRYGYGTMRDYVIGIHAVDGRGVAFKGGGRVVKNVAGYDFCKLLTGSLGTLGVITQLALKVKPLPECSATVVADCATTSPPRNRFSRGSSNLAAPPVAIDLLVGAGVESQRRSPEASTPARATLVVRVEGTEAEVDWLAEHVQYEFWQGGATGVAASRTNRCRSRSGRSKSNSPIAAPADTHDDSPLVLKIAVPPSAVIATIAELRAARPDVHNPSPRRPAASSSRGSRSSTRPT